MSPENLFRALSAVGAFYRADGDTLWFPKGSVPRELGEEIREHKRALLAGACTRCRAELATCGDRCAWCHQVRGREVAYVPGSEAEARFLSALAGGP